MPHAADHPDPPQQPALRQAILLLDGRVPLDAAARALLDLQLDDLARQGFGDIRIVAGGDAPAAHLQGRSRHGADIRLAVAASALEALLHEGPGLRDSFLLVAGDRYFGANLRALAACPLGSRSLARTALRRAPGAAPVPAGALVLARDALQALARGTGPGAGPDLASIDAAARSLAATGRLEELELAGPFLDLARAGDRAAAHAALAALSRRPAAFLDRDGVLNIDRGYVHRPQDFAWMPGAPAAIRALNDAGCRVLVVTNQSGVARGLYAESDVRALHAWMNDRLAAEGAYIDAFYHCPHHPTEGRPPYRAACDCRKPAPGMLLQGLREWDIDAARSVLVGDKASDLEAARAAGIAGHLYSGGDLAAFVRGIVGALACSSGASPRRGSPPSRG